MSSVTISESSFQPSKQILKPHMSSRPSVSYWEDSVSRFRQNRRASFSGLFVLMLIVSSVIGPLIWRSDPAIQDVSQISQPPWADRSVSIIERSSGNPTLAKSAVDAFQIVGQPNTKRVELGWPTEDENTTHGRPMINQFYNNC